MLGACVVGTGIFSGYKWYDWHKTPDIPYMEKHFNMISALAETILPSGDSPGAREAGVPNFIIRYVRECQDALTSNKFIDGLKEVDRYCHSRFNGAYEHCSEEEQVSVLRHFEQKEKPLGGVLGKVQNRLVGKPFFLLLKEYTVKGYCTSEAGMTRGLSYLPVPGSFHGCLPFLPGQKAWATR